MIIQNKTILTFIDVQGKLAEIMYQRDELFANLEKLVKGMQILDIPILWLEQLPEKLGPTRPELEPLLRQTAEPLAKAPFSAWGSGDYRRRLKESRRTRVVLCGIETHVCVYQTAKDLLERGYGVILPADCVSSRTRENRDSGVAAIRDLGAEISSVEMLLFEILATPEHPRFRDISKLVK